MNASQRSRSRNSGTHPKRRPLYILIATFLAVLLGSSPAWASGYFTWSAHLKYNVNSRQWTQGGGSTTIYSLVGCNGDFQNQYVIDLWKKNTFLPTNEGSVVYTCDQDFQYTWRGLPGGTYYFILTKADDGIYWDPSGTVSYP